MKLHSPREAARIQKCQWKYKVRNHFNMRRLNDIIFKLTTLGRGSPSAPHVAFISTLLDELFVESTADVFAVFKAVNVFFAQLDVKRRLGLQTIQHLGKELSANLQRALEKTSGPGT